MPLIIFFLFLLLGVVGWLINGWVSTHALAVLENGEYIVTAKGWGLFLSFGGPMAGLGLLIGLGVGFLAGSHFLGLLSQKRESELDATREALVAERKKLEAGQAALDAHIHSAALQARKEVIKIAIEATETAQKSEQARIDAEYQASLYKRRLEATTGRLKGAQQKAARINKRKAQLTSPNGTKPASGLVR